MIIGDLCKYAPKSSIKAGEAEIDGKYMFFTSSTDENKRYSDFQLDCEGIIMGTGGNATLHYYNGKFSTSTDCVVLLPNDKIRCKYLYYFFLHNMPLLQAGFKGAGLKHTNKNYINNITISSLPTIQTQDETINALDKVSNIISSHQQQLQKLDELVKSRFIELFGDPIENPMCWPVKPLKEISTLITNGNTPKGGSENYVESGITFLRSQNVWRNRIELDDVAYIDEETHNKMKKSSLHHKDILITKTGRINTENSSLGRAALYLGEDNQANINGHVYLVRLDGSMLPEFVVTILTGEAYRKYIRKVCVGGIDKRQINVDQVENFPIILPSIELQKGFADFRTQVDKSKLAVQQGLEKLETLKKSLMQQYFG